MKKVEVYIKNETISIPYMPFESHTVFSPYLRGSSFPFLLNNLAKGYKTFKIIPEADRRVLEMVEKIASEKNLEVKVYDVEEFKGKVYSFLKRIKKTPAIIFNGKKKEGKMSEEELKLFLEHELNIAENKRYL